jgi:hypothetical protein
VRKLFLNDQLRCGQFTPAECGQINWRMQFITNIDPFNTCEIMDRFGNYGKQI